MTVALVIAGLLAFAWCLRWVLEARDRRRYPMPGRLVSAGDSQVHVLVQGSGPVVLIDSGLGGSSVEWESVVAELRAEFTVVTYDRPGYTWSPGSRVDRSTLAAARRIIAILDALEVREPAILVGHSLGGIHVRAVAALHPDRVSALVLVDPSHEDMLEAAEASKAATAIGVVMRVLVVLAPFGVTRVLGGLLTKAATSDVRQPLSAEQQKHLKISTALIAKTVNGTGALAAEHAALSRSLEQMAELARSGEPSLPLRVITASAPNESQRMIDARAQMDALHVALVDAREQAQQLLALESGHLVPLDQPQIVAEAVRQVAP